MAGKTQGTEATEALSVVAIQTAKQLEYDRAQLLKRVDANRKLLRLLDENELLSEDEGAWLDDFYPTRERGATRDENAAKRTLAVRKAARQEIGGVDEDEAVEVDEA